jgi:hypothetical protein
MFNGPRLLQFAPAVGPVFVTLGVTVLRPGNTSDYGFGARVGVFIGLSIIAILALQPRAS